MATTTTTSTSNNNDNNYASRRRSRRLLAIVFLALSIVSSSSSSSTGSEETTPSSQQHYHHNNNDNNVNNNNNNNNHQQQQQTHDDDHHHHHQKEEEDYGNHNSEWEDGPSSWEEFGHDNDPAVCGMRRLTVEEWEAGKYWEGGRPVIVRGVTEGWKALDHWKKQEMVRRYGDAEATMGEARLVGETGPDQAGKNLSPTTVKEFITKHMYNPLKYFFDRKIAIPKGMLQDCHPFPMPTRAYLANPRAGEKYAPSKKRKVRTQPDRELWRDHLAISIGSDLQGLTFHHHREAWNAVIFGKKRWIVWDHDRWKNNETMQWRLTRDWASEEDDREHITSAEWIRRLYPEPDRKSEIRNYGHDCIQHAGEMMFVPHRWMHMVVNIGDTVSVISEVGLGIGEGKKPEDFLFDPDESSSDDSNSEDNSDSEDWSEDGREDGRESYDGSKKEDDEDRREYYARGGGDRNPEHGYWYDSGDGNPDPGYWYWDSNDGSEDE